MRSNILLILLVFISHDYVLAQYGGGGGGDEIGAKAIEGMACPFKVQDKDVSALWEATKITLQGVADNNKCPQVQSNANHLNQALERYRNSLDDAGLGGGFGNGPSITKDNYKLVYEAEMKNALNYASRGIPMPMESPYAGCEMEVAAITTPESETYLAELIACMQKAHADRITKTELQLQNNDVIKAIDKDKAKQDEMRNAMITGANELNAAMKATISSIGKCDNKGMIVSSIKSVLNIAGSVVSPALGVAAAGAVDTVVAITDAIINANKDKDLKFMKSEELYEEQACLFMQSQMQSCTALKFPKGTPSKKCQEGSDNHTVDIYNFTKKLDPVLNKMTKEDDVEFDKYIKKLTDKKKKFKWSTDKKKPAESILSFVGGDLLNTLQRDKASRVGGDVPPEEDGEETNNNPGIEKSGIDMLVEDDKPKDGKTKKSAFDKEWQKIVDKRVKEDEMQLSRYSSVKRYLRQVNDYKETEKLFYKAKTDKEIGMYANELDRLKEKLINFPVMEHINYYYKLKNKGKTGLETLWIKEKSELATREVVKNFYTSYARGEDQRREYGSARKISQITTGLVNNLKPMFSKKLKQHYKSDIKTAKAFKSDRGEAFKHMAGIIKDCALTSGMHYMNKGNSKKGARSDTSFNPAPKKYIKYCKNFMCDKGIPIPNNHQVTDPNAFKNYQCKLFYRYDQIVNNLRDEFVKKGTFCGNKLSKFN